MSGMGKIGVFDSGFGGLDVFHYIDQKLPDYDLVYLGDTARTPYGTRSKEVVYQYVTEALDFLFSKDCELVILACNTASAEALPKIQQEYLPNNYPDKKVLGVLIPVSEETIEVSKNRKIGVMATESTVESGAYDRELKKLNPEIKLFSKACPLLVPIIESGEDDSVLINRTIKNYLNPLLNENIDTLILGCTHYGILENRIKDILKERESNLKVISGGNIVADKLSNYLDRHSEIDQNLSRSGNREIYTTDLTDKFKIIGEKLFGKKIDAKKISL